jgi:hypothetical protein
MAIREYGEDADLVADEDLFPDQGYSASPDDEAPALAEVGATEAEA